MESVGTEEDRFKRLLLAGSGCIEAGNEAEGDIIGLKKGWRRVEDEFDRRIGFGGGVGGVAIQVGVDRGNKTRRDERIGVVDAGRVKKVRPDSRLGLMGRATSVGSIRGPTSEGEKCGEQGDCIASNAEDG